MALLSVDNLSVSFVTRNGTNTAVNNVSFSVEERQITAIIGESGSGKSVCCYAMLGLVPSPPGRIDGGTAHFQGQDLLALSESELRDIRDHHRRGRTESGSTPCRAVCRQQYR